MKIIREEGVIMHLLEQFTRSTYPTHCRPYYPPSDKVAPAIALTKTQYLWLYRLSQPRATNPSLDGTVWDLFIDNPIYRVKVGDNGLFRHSSVGSCGGFDIYSTIERGFIHISDIPSEGRRLDCERGRFVKLATYAGGYWSLLRISPKYAGSRLEAILLET